MIQVVCRSPKYLLSW